MTTQSETPARPRLLQAIAGAPRGGAELHFVRLCLALKRAGVQQRVIMRPHHEPMSKLNAAGIQCYPARFGGLLDIGTTATFRRVIRDFGPEIILTYMSRASRFCPKGEFLHLARLGGYYDMKYYRNCDHLICISPDLVEHCVRNGFPRDRVHLIPNFIEERVAAPFERADLNTPTAAPLVFALGRLHENKAFDILLQAIAKVPEAYLWIAGDGPLKADLMDQRRDLGIIDRVRFLGWQQDPAPYFAAADLFVVPSRHEPLGSVVLEGWMHRLPMVAAASQGPNFLVRDGADGLIVPVDDAEAMAVALKRLIDEPWFARQLAENGRRRYEEEFTQATAVERYLRLFGSVLHQGSESYSLADG